MIPISKDRNKHRSKAENYRPSSLISLEYKVKEHIIHSNIISHIDQQIIKTYVQHGFRKSQLCETQLIKTVNDIGKSLNEGHRANSIL